MSSRNYEWQSHERIPRNLSEDIYEAILLSYPSEGWRAGIIWADNSVSFGEVIGWKLPTGDTPVARVRRLRRKYVPVVRLDDGEVIEGIGGLVMTEGRVKKWLDNGKHR